MAKKLAETSSDSSLSQPPEDIVSSTENHALEDTAQAGRKRKAAVAAKPTAKRTRKVDEAEAKVEDMDEVTVETSRPKRRTTSKTVVEKETVVTLNHVKKTPVETSATTTSRQKDISDPEDENEEVRVEVKAKAKKATVRSKTTEEPGEKAQAKKVVKRKTPVVKNLDPLAERTTDTKLRVGAHVSAAGGVHNSLLNLVHIGGNAFALFLKSQRKWDNSELDPEIAKLFLAGCKTHSINPSQSCLPHGSYLVNLAHPEPARKTQAYTSFLNDLNRCHTLGITLYNFHPGNANASPSREHGLQTIAQQLNAAHRDPASGTVITLLETMATLGNTLGGTFADLAAIIAQVDDKSRVGVCLDTCHVFAAGYDLRSPAAYAETLAQFDQHIGLAYLKAFHINDSKAPLGSHRDLHARIGTGYLGLRAFHNLVNDARFHGLPMVLETPCEIVAADGTKVEDKGVWAREIKLLESLVGMDVEGDVFQQLEAELWEQGSAERDRVGGQVDRKSAKAAQGKAKAKAKAEAKAKPPKATATRKGKKVDSSEEDDSADEVE